MASHTLRSVVYVLVLSSTLAVGTISRAEEIGASVSATFGKIPLYFEPNLGQAPDGVEFLARGEGYVALVTQDGVSLQLRSGSCGETERKGSLNREMERHSPEAGSAETPCTTEVATLKVEGRSKRARLIPEQKLEGISNYLMGKDSSRWLTHIPQFGSVRVADVYPGIDMVLKANGKNLRYDFEVMPGADAGNIQLRLEGAEKTELTGERLIHHLKGGRLEQLHLRVSQGAEEIVGAGFSVTSGGRIGFHVPRWNRREKLMIDPTLAWSTYLGGYGPEEANAITVDGYGSAYVTGNAANSVFPVTAGTYDANWNGYNDVFVTKLNATGTGLVYSTFLGGSDDEVGYGIAVDASGSAYVTGSTTGSDFPVTAGAYDGTFNGYYDAFVTKLNAAGTGLVYSTFLGGRQQDLGKAILVDASGSAHVTGSTASSEFPVSGGAYDTSFNGGSDAFISKLNPAGTVLVYSTFLGSPGSDGALSIALDASGNVHVTGETDSAAFPVTSGACDTSFNGNRDAFVTKLNATGTGLVYSTFLGGSSQDDGRGIAVDSSGSAYVTGHTGSPDFPVTAGAFDTADIGTGKAFVTKLDATGTGLVYSTFLGGSSGDSGDGIAVDAFGTAFVTGNAYSSDFPVTAGAYDTSHNGAYDVFVTKLNATGSGLLYSTFIGGSSYDFAVGIAVDASGSAYVTGHTFSESFPVTAGAYDTAIGGDLDAFVTKLSTAGDSLVYSTFLGGAGSSDGQADITAITLDGSGSVYVTGATQSAGLPTTLGAYDTSFNGNVDAFVTKLNTTGTGLVFSTFLGGSRADFSLGIIVDVSGNAYVTGYTGSPDFPVTAGAFDTSLINSDAFVTKLNATGTGLVYSTFLGGSASDSGSGIAVDSSGNAFVAGQTDSSNFPVTAAAYDTTSNGSYDAFVTKLNAAGMGILYSTFLGGSGYEYTWGIAVDGSGNACVAGRTTSSDFPATAGAYDSSYNGGDDAFVAKLNAAGTGLVYSTFLGGPGLDYARGIAVDASGNTYLTGYTESSTFPVSAGAYDIAFNGSIDAFVTKLNMTGNELVYSTFLGGSSWDYGMGVAVDASGSAHVVGDTHGSGFPVTADAYDTTYNGNGDLFVTTLDAAGTGLVSSTFLGGSNSDLGRGIALDPSGSVYLTGNTQSLDFPATAGAFQGSLTSSGGTGFVAKLSPSQAPTITTVASLIVARGTTTANVLVATVTDADTSPPALAVRATGAPPGIVVSNFVLTPTTPGNYNVTADIIATCYATATGPVNLEVTDMIAPPATGSLTLNTSGSGTTATLTGGATLCAGEGTTLTVALAGLAPWTLTWSDGYILSGITTSPASRVVSPAVGTTTYTVSVADAYGCAGTASGSATVIANPRPTAPVPAIPANGSTYSGAFVSWTHAGGTWYDVYLDTVPSPEKLIFSGETSNLEAFIPSWVPGVTYYWKVVARSGCGTASSPVWSFVAGSCPWAGTGPTLVSPANGATGIGANPTLTWNSVAGTAHFDVYIGTTAGTMNWYDMAQAPETSVVVPVSPGATYYWKVIAVPVCGSAVAATSTTNSFTTGGTALGMTAFAPMYFNRWETGTVTLTGSGFTAAMGLFTDLDGNAAGTLVPTAFTNPTQLQATLTGNPVAPAGRYDVGVVEGGLEEGRLHHALALRAFTDVTENDYYYLSSARMADAGIMESDLDTGTAGPQFSPATNVTRALMAEYLAKSYQYWRTRTTALPPATCTPAGAGSTDFPDVACSHPNWLAIHWIKAWGVTTGSPCPDGLCFNPNNSVNRAEMVTFIERLRQTGVLGTLLWTVGEKDPGCATNYPECKGWSDAGGVMDVAAWPRREANLAFQDRITSGCGGTVGNNLTFCPYDSVTRGQIGEFLARTLGLVPMP